MHPENVKGFVVHASFNAHGSSSWYLDSGCSRQMTGDPSLFTKIEKFNGGPVIFGDSNGGKIKGKGIVSIPGFSPLNDVLFVEGLKENLLSVSQFCDDMQEIKFSKECCSIYSSTGKCIVKRSRSADDWFWIDTLPTTVCHFFMSHAYGKGECSNSS